MFQLYFTQSGAAWSTRELIWRSDMAVEPAKYGIYNLRCGVEINKAGELEFLMTKSCSSYNKFAKERSVLTLLMDDSVPIFRGVVKTIETDLFFQRTIKANSDLVYLSDSVFEPHGDDIEEKPSARFKRIIDHHNVEMQGDPEKQFQIGNFTFESGADDIEKYTKNGGYKDTMSQLKNDFKDFYGFYQIRYNEDFSQKWLDYTETTGKSTSQDIKFAVNIQDYQFKDTVDDLFTILIPVGADNLMLENQNAHRTVDIRMPDQSKRTIEVYVVDKYIKIVEAIQAYGYIYQAESFTVDSNNIGASGTNGRVGGGGGGSNGNGARTGYEYGAVYVGGDPDSDGKNPAAEGLYYISNGNYVKATETSPVYGRAYYNRTRPTYYKIKNPEGSPAAKGWYEYSNGVFRRSGDNSVVSGKTYYSTAAEATGGGDGGGGGGGSTVVWTQVVLLTGANPAAMGLWYKKNGVYVQATETVPQSGRVYYKRTETGGGGGGGGGGSSKPTYSPVSNIPEDANPKARGWYEKRAFTIDTYIKTSDTEVRFGKTYYTQD